MTYYEQLVAYSSDAAFCMHMAKALSNSPPSSKTSHKSRYVNFVQSLNRPFILTTLGWCPHEDLVRLSRAVRKQDIFLVKLRPCYAPSHAGGSVYLAQRV